ncbi:zinc-dependent alcohol dehydrogenase [Thermostaphylospora chromogena]|uniref:2-desacetyl-2-hydroxyethyl bacteriochlorophyllide A dehydrogenase n=1 Tax=Thermostaphylospora chromogena TaxID=35622 RepID=A0A1H1HFE1_9ACTN|nr:zinc-binding alcohol dehydrogenase [Thermostaphylospora chromogena]SDR24171.1 2-desacetyl-2-hydroxyethyl bacteriochlorophyllide A dehydrogenase [Thermostaphylospora chromogena]
MHVIRFEEPGVVRLAEEPPDELLPGCVRVRTLYSGVSAGTELTAYRGTNPYLNRRWDAERRLFVEGRTHDYPLSGWGYQEVGEVVEAAPDVADPPLGSLVWGIWGHRAEAVVPAVKLTGHVLPPEADPLTGVFARVGAIALNAVHCADIHLGDQVAVFGQGVIGLLVTRLAVLSGARVVAADAIPGRLELARRFGAAEVFDVTSGSCAEFVRKRIEGADTAIEMSGSHLGLHEAIRTVRRGGRVVAAGFYQGDGIGLRLGEEFHHNQVQLVSSQIGAVASWLAHRWDVERLQRTFMELALRGEVDTAGLVSHVVDAQDAAEAFEMLDRRPADVLQLVFRFSGSSS